MSRVSRTLSLYKSDCVGSSSVLCLVLRWVSFGWKIFGENGQNLPFLQKSQVSTSTES